MGTLDGKTAIITGASQGVGRGIALALAAEGAQVVVCSRTASTLDAACDAIRQRGGTALAVTCDVVDPAALEQLVARTVDTFGTIDILVNNAMVVPHGSILETDEAAIEAAWSSGPLAALRLMRLSYPYLRGKGAVVNISSGAAVQANPVNRGIYAATKAALNSISRAAANEWGPEGIRVNVVMPFARSDAVAHFFDTEPEYAAGVLAAIPLRRVGDPEEDIGRAVAFLVGPAAGYITGAILPVDGGAAYIR